MLNIIRIFYTDDDIEFINRLTDEEKGMLLINLQLLLYQTSMLIIIPLIESYTELDESYELLQALKRKDDTSKGDSVINKDELKGTEHSNPYSLNLDDIWKKASKEKSKTNDRMVIYCSKVLEVRNEFKVVLFPFLQNKKNEVYWCYKPEIFGFHNRCMAEVLSLSNKNFPIDMFTNYDEVFKRGDGDTIEVSNSMKTPNADPTRNGNKLLFYVVSVDKESDEKLDVVIHNFMNSLIMMQKHPQYRKYCLDKTFIEYGGKYNENMKLSICNDRAFERIMDSGIIHVEKNVSLYDLTNTDGVCYILNQMFAHSKPPLLTWGYALKSFCFNGGNIPKGFAFPK